MHLRDAGGVCLHFTIRELLKVFLSPTAGVYLALAIVVHFAADPPGLRAYLSNGQSLVVWLLSTMLYLTSYFVLLGLCAVLQTLGWTRPVFLPVVGALALAPTVCASEVLVHLISDRLYPITIVPKIAYYFLTVQVFEFAFIRLVIPKALDRQTTLRTLNLRGRTIPVARLRYMVAQEHYVRLVLDDAQSVLLRTRFGDLLGQLQERDGIQPHRSWWVARASDPRLMRRGGRHVMQLADGTDIPVARSRLSDVRDWLDAHGSVPVPRRTTRTAHDGPDGATGTG